MVINTPAVAGQAICNRVIVGRISSTGGVDFISVDHEGTRLEDFQDISITVSDQGENNQATITVNNGGGDFNDPFFTRYDYVDIRLGTTGPIPRIMRGLIFDFQHEHRGKNDMIVNLDIRGPEHVVMKRRATEEYISTEISAIVKDLIDTYLSDIIVYDAGSIVSTGVTYDKVQFQRVPLWSIFKNLSMAVDYTVRLVWSSGDSKWKMNFKPINTTSSGKTLNADATSPEIQIGNIKYGFQGVTVLNRQVVFGGTDAITADPIAKQFDDLVRQGEIGVLEGDDIRDDNITSSAWAKDIARAVVRNNSIPRKVITCQTEHLEDLDVGETVRTIDADLGVDEDVTLRNITYRWEGGNPEYTCDLVLNQIPRNLMDAVSKLKEDIDMLKSNASDSSELEKILQFYQQFDFTEGLIITSGAINDTMIWGHPDNGKWGRNKWGDQRTNTIKVSV